MLMRQTVKQILSKARLLLAAVLLFGAQGLLPVSAMLPKVSAAPICVIDTAGPNDEPGQKDLNKLCLDYAGAPTTVATTWNWDETGTSGANTMDACNLFDTDGDGNINYAVCVTTQDSPATLQATTTYSCGDAKIDRCTSPATPISNGTTSCAVSQVTNDPFAGPPNSAKGDSYPKDTQGSCTVQLSAVGGATAKLIDVCSYPSEQPNSDPSDCVIARDNAGKIEVVKHLVPSTDAGLFNLSSDGPDANDTTTVTNVGNNGTTGEVVVKAGTVVVKETAGTNTQLGSYNTSIVCKDLNGTGTTVGQSSPTGASSRQLSFALADQADVVCVITNTRQQATLVLQKTVVNNNGGTLTQSNFPVAVSGNSAQWGSNSVAPGSYTVSETQQPGYIAGVWGGDCDGAGNVTLADGQTKTCTITNDDVAGQMKVVKHVVNDNGGTAAPGDFTLSVNGQAKTQSQYFSANAGSYTVTESGPSGYTQTGIACVDDNTQQAVAHPVQLALAQSVTCTVTNDDSSASLTVIKHVVNDNGGTKTAPDFTMHVSGTNVSSPSFPGNESGTAVTLNAGNFLVSEGNLSAYSATYSGDCSGSIAVGEHKTCTITNDDNIPLLTLLKTVVNSYGGTLQVSDFPLFVSGTQVTSGAATGFNAGNYTASETQQPGYIAGVWGGDCAAGGSIMLSIGDNKTCTLTNYDQPGTLIVKKIVVNDNGGTKAAQDFSFKVNGGTSQAFEADGQNDLTVNAGTYSVVEDSAAGYAATYDNCINVQIPNGGTATCTITNSDKAAHIKVTKEVVNDNGGAAKASDFTLKVNNTMVASGVSNSFDGNVEYTVSEADGPSGYDQTGLVCQDVTGEAHTAVANPFTAQLGHYYSCVITNDDQPGTLIVKKIAVNNNGGAKEAQDFSFKVNGGTSQAFEADGQNNLSVNAGDYTVAETAAPDYDTSYEDCVDIHIANGGTATCTITNNDIAPKLTIVKRAYPERDSNQEFAFTSEKLGDFSLTGDGTASSSKQFSNLLAGHYTVTELDTTGWMLVDSNCEGTDDFDGDNNSLTVNLHIGDDVTCTFVNDEQNHITGAKFNDLNDNGAWDEDEPGLEGWTIQLHEICLEVPEIDALNLLDLQTGDENCNGIIATTQTDEDGNYTFHNLDPGFYQVCEVQQDGWMQTFPTDHDGCHQLFIQGPGETSGDHNFGNFKKGEVKGVKFNDVNGNGKQDNGEPTLKNWEITLSKECPAQNPSSEDESECAQAVIGSIKTDASGSYSFGKLEPGMYKVCETMQANWTQTFPATTDGCTHFTVDQSGEVVVANFGNKPKPQVLSETTQLVNTGSPAAVGLTVGLTILGALGGLRLLTRRNSHARQ